jgi:hypothetical protein
MKILEKFCLLDKVLENLLNRYDINKAEIKVSTKSTVKFEKSIFTVSSEKNALNIS